MTPARTLQETITLLEELREHLLEQEQEQRKGALWPNEMTLLRLRVDSALEHLC